jgi:hypothetical protein
MKIDCRLIMSLTVPMFFALISKNMRLELGVNDCTPTVMNKVLEFIYTHRLSFVDERVALIWDVMEAAILYGVPELQLISEATLAAMLTIKTVCSLWLLASDAGALGLARAAHDFFVEHLDACVFFFFRFLHFRDFFLSHFRCC